MTDTSKHTTVYIEPDLYAALRLKAARSDLAVSDIVNDAVRCVLSDDHEDLAVFEGRENEPVMSFEALLDELKP